MYSSIVGTEHVDMLCCTASTKCCLRQPFFLFLSVISRLHDIFFIMPEHFCYYFNSSSVFRSPNDCQRNLYFFRKQLPILLTYYSYKIFVFNFFFDDFSKQTCVSSKRRFVTLFHRRASIFQHILLTF